MAYNERYFITPVADGERTIRQEEGKPRTLPAYLDRDGQVMLWSNDFNRVQLPDIGDKITITMNHIGPAIVRGYFAAGEEGGEMWLGVMTEALAPPQWLREQHKREQRESLRWHERPDWYKQGIGCEHATEIRGYARGDMAKQSKWLKESGR